MIRYMKISFFISILICSFQLLAQSPQFSQFYANQVYLNPAFTGNTEINRLAGNYRNQWSGIPNAFQSYSLAYDHNLAVYNLGLGLLAVRDEAGTGGLSYTNIAGLVSYKFSLSESISMRAGISYGVGIRAADASRYVFGDQLVTGGSTTANINAQKTYGDFGSGILVFGGNFWAGISALHMNRPNESLVAGQESEVPINWSMHGGYNFALDETEKGVVTKSIIPTFNYKWTAKFDQLDMGAYFQRKALIVGVWYRGLTVFKKNQDGSLGNDAVIVMGGVQLKGFRAGYSYDLTSSQLGVDESHGSHEISVVYEWPTNHRKKKKRKKNFIVPCPKF
jgi:type IX secretion system PorP/SprF family membrane protein